MTMRHLDGVCAIEKLRKSYAEFERKVSRAFDSCEVSEKGRLDFQAIIGKDYAREKIFRSDLRAGLKAGTIFVSLMSKMFGRSVERAARGKQGTYFALSTFINSDWNCSDRTAAINIQSIRNKVSKSIRDAGLNGIAVIEVQALTNYPEQGKGKTLMANVHALVWARSPIDHAAWERAVAQSSAWRADFGCPPLVVQGLLEDSLEDRSNIERVAGYLMKAPHDAKFRKPQKKKPEHFMFQPTQKGYSNRLALRILECLAYLPLFEMVFGVGPEGICWCNKWRRQLRCVSADGRWR
ncbi:hypothetical protein [Sphingopyxis sp. HXXIV]|uniref:hypothetical protein n=1 Tax=Sphingopyxis sp. HXXIV TaxID=1759075 RepID=UPI0012E394E4|nr:hypothetical protein [Sphingopyxis sp. HXXIV]